MIRTMTQPYEGQARSRMGDHVWECGMCIRGLLCPVWEQLYTASPDGSDSEESRARMREHLHECDRCRLDQPCEDWDQLYAAS
ncbi:MAG: zf-HC2 domain-containing protein [Candidatus Dormibacteria bacterium]